MRVEAVKSMHIRMALRLWATLGLWWDRSGRRSPVASIKRPLDEVNDVSRAASWGQGDVRRGQRDVRNRLSGWVERYSRAWRSGEPWTVNEREAGR